MQLIVFSVLYMAQREEVQHPLHSFLNSEFLAPNFHFPQSKVGSTYVISMANEEQWTATIASRGHVLEALNPSPLRLGAAER